MTSTPGFCSGAGSLLPHRPTIARCVAALSLTLLVSCASTGDPDFGPTTAMGTISDARQDKEPAGPQLTERQQRQIDLIAPILLESTDTPDDGRLLAAAQELLALEVESANQVLDKALRSGQPNQMLAVLRAMISEQDTPPRLRDTAVELLPNAPEPVQETLWRFLAKHEVDLLDRVAALALDQAAPQQHRLSAIGALGAFRTRDAADKLIDLLGEDRGEPEEILDAVCTALTRLTRLPYGDNPQTWRAWWVNARNQSREQWLVDQVQRLATDRAELERELTLQRQRIRRTEQRVVDVLRDLFRTLPSDVDQQLAPLPTLLEDELTVVREFAIERIRFISRDHEIPDTLVQALAGRLDDPDAEIRARTARLLYELNFDGLNDMLAERLASETSFDVMKAYIELLAERPTRSALAALVQRANDPNLSDISCNAIWNTLVNVETDESDADLLDDLRGQLNSAMQRRTSSSIVRLAVYLAADDEQLDVNSYLDGDDASLRTAVADALAERGDLQPLLDRADDVAIYPIAIRVLASNEPTIDTLRSVVELPPPAEPVTGAWLASISRVVMKLPPAQLIDADKLLEQANVPPSARIELLSRLSTIPAEQLPVEQRTELVKRLASLRLQRQQYLKAHQELEVIVAANGSPELIDLKFEAALLSGHYNRAAEFKPTAEPWITMVESVASTDTALAGRIQTEIDRRFGSALSDDLKARMEALRQVINGDEPDATAPPESAPS